ncbi:tellurite resistance/C4-dicarboxylate transporter family protein [Tomitella biformata]|uniref:tellurite resistance/C4-dicarboxylate transporter family protein n=1 Tax=Tomitella biformata TaxID=630403 RepID=UPI0004678FC3|nr:tellurite resistance/C4-dicarboxylate transporter family protein [Tomitella biformata]
MTGAVETLNPGYFALVMATGILSVAMDFKGLDIVSAILLAITAGSWVLLVLLTGWRILRHWARFRADFTDPGRGFGFFTFTAATGVLGARLAEQSWPLAAGLLAVAAASWFLLGYLVPWTAVLHSSSRSTLSGANGTWFMWVVASQSVAVLAAILQPNDGLGRRELAMLAVFCWSVGAFLYAGVAVLVAARLMLYPQRPADLLPAYWVSMGATAITVLAGSQIVEMADTPMIEATRGLIAGCSVVFWAFGTWLIPILIAAGIWRHIIHKWPLRYDATLWSIIFPLGMYAAASHYLGVADHLPIVRAIGDAEAWFAMLAWTAVFVAMIRHLWLTLVLGRGAEPAQSLAP